MAKTTKKRANAKGAAKKAAPTKAKPKRKGLRAPVKGKQRTAKTDFSAVTPAIKEAWGASALNEAFAPRSVSRCTLDLREHLTVEDQYEADQAHAVAKPKRYRFRDAITGLFVRARDALRRKRTTVSERVK